MSDSITEFTNRRQQLLNKIGDNALAILTAAPQQLRNQDVHFPFRQSSNFYYLSGFKEPHALLVLAPGREAGEVVLFNQPKDPLIERWEGPRLGQDQACAVLGMDQAFPIDDLDEVLPDLLANRESLYYTLGDDAEFDTYLIDTLNELRQKAHRGPQVPTCIMALNPLLNEMRLIKSEAEQAKLRHAAEVSAKAHCRAMAHCKVGMNEYHLEAEIIHELQSQNCRSVAYPAIVAAGGNTCFLHYTENNSEIHDGDLILIDAGAEYQYYAADITRTFPANGKFSAEQKAIYDIVLAAQLAGIEKITPGTPWADLQATVVKVITQGLIDLNLLQGNCDDLIEQQAYNKFYMHNAGHWLGMDVHDVGDYKVNKQWRELQAGMAMTMEPGIYIPADTPGVDQRWWNIGIRIEDDVLVTPDGNEILSAMAPKTIDDIEALMAEQ